MEEVEIDFIGCLALLEMIGFLPKRGDDSFAWSMILSLVEQKNP
jgi:hypothetical protein